ncbi:MULTISPECIES: (Na+)-NQR maturation NqrM [Oceanimonas]|uniref:(Na+)-NQR maturation NqrM n=1 Tax=Oceanimonas smirnovii TaxID=264574 RepID=A0ABW7P2A6_9GAMM|nr:MULTISPECIES: (Na+)-NQR maturation NqrM [Oceanimonas]MDV2858032.1 (Na+)-NQR maturation NqrM [Oceanimonas sp. CAM02]
MLYFLITFGVFALVVAAMAIGYIIQRKTISGSCGGLGGIGVEKACDCPDPCDNRKKKMAKEEARRQMLEENRII